MIWLNFSKDLNISEKYFYQRPSSSLVLVNVPNVEIKIYRIRSIQIGSGVDISPKHIGNSRSVISITDLRGRKHFPYTDNLCLFRCLGLNFGADVEALDGVSQESKLKLE